MPMRKSVHNMYPWVDLTWNPLSGECGHKCQYCYMKQGVLKKLKKYQGPSRFAETEKSTQLNYFKDMEPPYTIFVCSGNDLFEKSVPDRLIQEILMMCNNHPHNTYLFQSKNPSRMADFYLSFPPDTILGTTIESNKDFEGASQAPPVAERAQWIKKFRETGEFKTMVSIEPILDFDVDEFTTMIQDIKPAFVSIGADSKKCNLPEPLAEKIIEFLQRLEHITEIKVKHNLERLTKN